MANPWHHAVSSSRQFGGAPEDYQAIHDWFDETKAYLADFRHRALRHHAEGIFLMESIFGPTVTLSTCSRCGKKEDEHPWREDSDLLLPRECLEFRAKVVPTRWVGEQHVKEDMGFIPPVTMWLEQLQGQPWMNRSRKLSRELEAEDRTQKPPHPSRVTPTGPGHVTGVQPEDASSIEADPMAAQRRGL